MSEENRRQVLAATTEPALNETAIKVESSFNQLGTSSIRYAQIRPYDVANGPGVRVTVFVSGCTHHCPGCFNEAYQDFQYGKPWTSETTAQIIEWLHLPVISGLTLLGGEPMQNLGLLGVICEIQAAVDKSIWIYSGYTYEAIIEHPVRRQLLSLCDVLVDGLFIEAQKDIRLRFRGSQNQRLIDIQSSLSQGQVVLYDV